jgi:hypothetical protein
VAIGEQPSIWRATARRGEVETPFSAGMRHGDDVSYADPLAHEPKWSRWKVTIVVVVFCAAFWSGVGYIAMRLLG